MQDRNHVWIRNVPILHSVARKQWLCGICESPLITIFDNGWKTVCAGDHSHSQNSFITAGMQERQEFKRQTYVATYARRKSMGFVKDRHSENGKILAPAKVRKAGRISLGRKLEHGGAEALPYFTIVSYDEGQAAEAILTEVQHAIERFTPEQDAERPILLPVYLPAASLELVASSQYKLAGKEGVARCTGDGEHIQFKLGAKNLMEIHHGKVQVSSLTIDGTTFNRGEKVPCPGRSYEGRWKQCEKCRLQFTVDLQIADLPWWWSLTTGDQTFYDQFFTVIELMDGHITDGNASCISDIPLLLRKEKSTKARPQKAKGGVELKYQEFDLITIAIHPVWLMQANKGRAKELGASQEIPQLESGKEHIEEDAVEGEYTTVKPVPNAEWYEVAEEGLPRRPWSAAQVHKYVTDTINQYSRTYDDFDEEASRQRVEAVQDTIQTVLVSDDDGAAIDTILWYLVGWEGVLSNAQAAALWYWPKRPVEKDGRVGTQIQGGFSEEVEYVLEEATLMAKEAGQEAPQTPDESMAQIGAVPAFRKSE